MANVVISVGQVDSVCVAVDNEVEASAVGIGDKLFIKGDKGDKGDPGDRGPQGVPGPQGIQGIQGPQGIPGNDGKDGKDGIDGKDGKDGKDGADGTNGTNGTDGVSPTVSITDITGGHRISITDAGGTSTADVMDGTNGANGKDGTDGKDGADGKDGTDGVDGTTFTPSVAANGDISWTNDGGKTNPPTVNIKGPQGEPGTTDYNELSNKPTIPSTAAEVGALPDTTNYAASPSVGGSAIRANSLPYGVVDGTSTATAFTVTIPGVTELYDGLCVLVKNNVIASKADCTLNVNNLGAKRIHYSTASNNQITTQWSSTMTALFYYDSTRNSGAGAWVMFYGYDSNTNTIGYQVRTNSMSLPMKSITYRYRILFESADGAHLVPATNSTSTNATSARTVCQDPINPFGLIVYYGTTASVAAGSRPSASYLWQQYTFNIGYSFQKSPNYVLTEWKPVYVKCAPQSDGSAIIDSTEPFVQALPTTQDGKIYIFLGVAHSTTSIELVMYHPVYYHDGTGIRIWAGSRQSRFLVTFAKSGNTYTMDKTAGEIYNALSAGILPVVKDNDSGRFIAIASTDFANDSYVTSISLVNYANNFRATGANVYPSYTLGGGGGGN